jgi:serine/threonine-protein kinase
VSQATEPVQAESDELVGTVLADTYRIEALLGTGGMGAVYKATHVLMRKTVALKVLHAEMASIPEALARFEREAVAAARIAHPNIASALDFGRLPDGSFYLVMEYVPGKLLREVLAAGALPTERVVGIGVQIALALEAAHAAGIVHRDLKPENVILGSQRGEDDQVKVLDLGIAHVPMDQTSGTKLTRAGAVLGTPQYMAPEQGLGGTVDHRSDLYALGVVLYEMAAGTPPFSDDDGAVAAIARHLTEAPPALPSAVPAELSSLILQLLEKQAANRPQSAAEVAERLRNVPTASAVVESAEGAALEVPIGEPPRRWSRLRVGACLAATAALALVVVMALRPNPASIEPAEPLSAPAATAVAPKGAAAPTPPPEATTLPAPAPQASAPPKQERSAPASKGKPKRSKKKDERRTGPGGIYIPPPEDWF